MGGEQVEEVVSRLGGLGQGRGVGEEVQALAEGPEDGTRLSGQVQGGEELAEEAEGGGFVAVVVVAPGGVEGLQEVDLLIQKQTTEEPSECRCPRSTTHADNAAVSKICKACKTQVDGNLGAEELT